jgi:putative Mn2+ efflux pump MntP
MDILVVLGIAVGLAMDAFAVALASSAMLKGATGRQTFRFAFHFGLFQFLMPVTGWAAGRTVEESVKEWDHWVAFGILAAIGTKAIWSALRGGNREEAARGDPTRGLSLVLLSIATSIDALAVGFSFAMIGGSIWQAAAIIGLVAAAFTVVGMKVGGRLGSALGWRMEAVGGAVLILIGIKILVDHLA